MGKVILTTKTQTLRENTTLMPDGFCGWIAQNIGTANVEVNGFVLESGEKLDLSNVASNVIWSSPIVIVCQSGGVLRIMRMYNLEG